MGCLTDVEAWAPIMRRHNQRLFRIARSIVGDDGAADDVVQEAYVKAFLNVDRFVGPRCFPTWLARIARNEARLSVTAAEVFGFADTRCDAIVARVMARLRAR